MAVEGKVLGAGQMLELPSCFREKTKLLTINIIRH
jgi:hypothetical protein